MYTSISSIVAFGLLVSAPLTSALAIPSQSQEVARSVEILDARHHTEAQIAVSPDVNQTQTAVLTIIKAKKAKAKGGRGIEVIEARHHTEAQIVRTVKQKHE